MENEEKLVEFEKWCPACVYEQLSESESPCFECLEDPVNVNSHRPTRFEHDAKKTHPLMN